MARIAIITVSDGRSHMQQRLNEYTRAEQGRLTHALAGDGHRVMHAGEIVSSNQMAVAAGRECRAFEPDLTILNFCVWAFPNFSVLAAEQTESPILAFCNLDPAYPGMVGMLAACGALDQLGRTHARAWGSVDDPDTRDWLGRIAAAARAVTRLKGSTFGRIGGRPMGMNTAVAATDRWMREFGIDVEEVDQFELVRRAELVDADRARRGRQWLEHHAAGVHYDGTMLTPAILERQVKTYHAMREVIDDYELDFCGIKGQPELTDHFCTMDVAEAFLNDPYDWEGPTEPVVCATEADMDGALTMKLIGDVAGTPALFADVRHFHAEHGVWDLCNSGQHATWFAARSDDPMENLSQVHLYPEESYFPAGGAAVHHLAAPGEMTFARMSQRSGTYRMQTFHGELVQFDRVTNEDLMRQSTFVWPHAFARFDVGLADVLSRFASNHVHGAPGDHRLALRDVCAFLGVEHEELSASQ